MDSQQAIEIMNVLMYVENSVNVVMYVVIYKSILWQ